MAYPDPEGGEYGGNACDRRAWAFGRSKESKGDSPDCEKGEGTHTIPVVTVLNK